MSLTAAIVSDSQNNASDTALQNFAELTNVLIFFCRPQTWHFLVGCFLLSCYHTVVDFDNNLD